MTKSFHFRRLDIFQERVDLGAGTGPKFDGDHSAIDAVRQACNLSGYLMFFWVWGPSVDIWDGVQDLNSAGVQHGNLAIAQTSA
jgi:hypothetical protein